ERHDLAVVVLLQPLENDGGIESSRIRQYNLLYLLRHDSLLRSFRKRKATHVASINTLWCDILPSDPPPDEKAKRKRAAKAARSAAGNDALFLTAGRQVRANPFEY